MKTVKNILLLQVLVLIFSCGPIFKEKASMQKAHDDSLRLVGQKKKHKNVLRRKQNWKIILRN